jgi:hypothetical protein
MKPLPRRIRKKVGRAGTGRGSLASVGEIKLVPPVKGSLRVCSR